MLMIYKPVKFLKTNTKVWYENIVTIDLSGLVVPQVIHLWLNFHYKMSYLLSAVEEWPYLDLLYESQAYSLDFC